MQRKAASFLLTLLLLVGPRQAEAQYRQLHFEEVTAPLIVMPDEGGALNLFSVAADDGERGGVARGPEAVLLGAVRARIASACEAV